MACFDNGVDRLKSAISNVEKKEEAKASMKKILFRKKCSEEGRKKS